jgi:Preprotein translocase subunit SecA (ATPase, RNA helicase)
MDKLQEHVERSLFAHYRYRRDQHYMIDNDKVILIDESTGRAQPDRHWRDGMHQAVEMKEGVTVTKASDHAAQITYQSYYRLYKKLAGMTGTAAQNWMELYRVYKLWVVCVPTNKPCIREQWPDRVFSTEDAKFAAAVAEIKRLHEAGRPDPGRLAVGGQIGETQRPAEGSGHSARRAQCPLPRPGSRNYQEGRRRGQGHRGHEHGRTRHRHQAGGESA